MVGTSKFENFPYQVDLVFNVKDLTKGLSTVALYHWCVEVIGVLGEQWDYLILASSAYNRPDNESEHILPWQVVFRVYTKQQEDAIHFKLIWC